MRLVTGILGGVLGAFLFCGGAEAAGVPLSCVLTNGPTTPITRAEGLSERVGDLVLVCTGGAPTATGSALPQYNITVTLNTNLTSRIMDANNSSDAILIVDEAGSGFTGAPTTQLACGTPLAGCSITSNGAEPYDGAAGDPNIFEGVATASNSVTFYGVPITGPGSYGVGGLRILRIVNVRADAAAFWSAAVAGSPMIQATVSITGSPAIAIGSGNPLTAAFVEFGLKSSNAAAPSPISLSGCVAGVACSLGTLNFQTNFSPALFSRTSVAANAQQNVPGAVYNSESGWFNTPLASSNANFAAIGVADSGTRLKATFENIPAGAQLWVTNGAVNGSVSPFLTANEAGPFSQVATQGTIGGSAAAQLTVNNGIATGVWEIGGLDQPTAWVVFPVGSTPSGSLTIATSFAPNADNGAFAPGNEAMPEGASYAVPRFTSGSPPSLNASESTSSITYGESAEFDIVISNSGGAPTSGTVTFQDQLFNSVIFVTNLTGSGWTCDVAALNCTRSDTLNPGLSYPEIKLTGNVHPGTAPQYMDQFSVSGGGSDTNTGSATVTINQQSQTITFAALAYQLQSSQPFTLSATTTSPLAVSFASTTSSVCQVNGTTVTLQGIIGVCTIQATQTGNATYAVATPVSQSFTVTQYLPCDLLQTGGSITVADVQVAINEALGVAGGTIYLDGGTSFDIVDVQIEINAALGLGCSAR